MTWVFATINFLILLVLALSTFLDVIHFFLYERGCWEPKWLVQMHDTREKRALERQMAIVEKVIKQHDIIIKNNKTENIKTFISQLGIKHDQFENELKYEIARLRSLPTRTMDETKAALKEYCTTKEPAFLVDQSREPEKVYPYVDYYINFIDMVFHEGLRRDLAKMLVCLMQDKLERSYFQKINKVIVPIGGNYLLGLAIAEKLNASIVKVRNEGHIYANRPWEGSLDCNDTSILVNDVLVTGKQIGSTLEKIQSHAPYLTIKGLFFLVERIGDDTNLNGRNMLENSGNSVHTLLKLSDQDLSIASKPPRRLT